MTSPDQLPHEVTYEGLWNSCVDLAAQLPGGLCIKRIYAAWLPRRYFQELPSPPSNLLEIAADVRWLGEVPGEVHFDGSTILEQRESTPDGAISDLENNILCSMGDPRIESFPTGFVIEDQAPRKSAHPALMHRLAEACLRWAGEEMFSVRTTIEKDGIHEEFARASSWTNLESRQGSKLAVFTGMLELMNIRRHLAVAIGTDTAVYDADYIAARRAYNGLYSSLDAAPALDIPQVRE